jgi:hypothetical protein
LADNTGMSLLDTVSANEMHATQIVTGTTMAAFLAVGLVPGLRQYAGTIRWALLGLYLAACCVFVGYVLLR